MHKTYQSLEVRQATWLELFFDLVFVAVIGMIAHSLAHTHDKHLSGAQLFQFLLTFLPILWVWSTHTMLYNRYDVDRRDQKFLTLAIMALVIVMSTFLHSSNQAGFNGFVLCYLAMRGLLAYGYAKAPKTTPEGDALARTMSGAILIGAAISALSLVVSSELREFVFYAGIAVEIFLQFRMSELAKHFSVHRKHLAERVGLLSLILIGETVISIVGTMSSAQELRGFALVAAVVGFILIAQIWWIYYATLHLLENAKRIRSGYTMIYSHLFFFVGLIFLANLVRHAINQDLDQQTFAIMSISGMSFFYIGKQIPYGVAFPPVRKAITLNSLLCLSITALAALFTRTEYSLMMMCLGMFAYVQVNVRVILPRYAPVLVEYLHAE